MVTKNILFCESWHCQKISHVSWAKKFVMTNIAKILAQMNLMPHINSNVQSTTLLTF